MEKLLSATVLAGLLVSTSAYAQSSMPVCNEATGYDQYNRNDHPAGVMSTRFAYGQQTEVASPGLLPSTGLDTDQPNWGSAYAGKVMSPCDSGATRIWLLTGNIPDPNGGNNCDYDPQSNPNHTGCITVTVSYDLTVPPVQINTSCFAQPVWTETWYAEGYPIPFWPSQTKVSDIQYDRDAHTVTVFLTVSEYQWIQAGDGSWHQVVEPMPMAAWSNYSMNLLCPGRDQG
jgi:hypothetical protein